MSDNPRPKIITARRAYEFGPDDLRLTMLTIQPVRERIKEAFSFQNASIGTPRASFGPVVNAIPPGLIFELGAVPFPIGGITPIRFLYIEPTRIAIDVGGESGAIDEIFTNLLRIVSELKSPDGSVVIGPARRIEDFSVFTMPLPFEPHELINPRLWPVFDKMLRVEGVTERSITVPLLRLTLSDADGAFPSSTAGDEASYSLETRAGSSVRDRLYFSAASLDSETHLTKLRELAAAFD